MLIHEQYIMSSDEDQPVVYDLITGYDDNFNLLVKLEQKHYDSFYSGYDDDPRFKREDSVVCAIISKDDAFYLAKRLGATMAELPTIIGESVRDYEKIVNPERSDVEDCFHELLANFDAEKCRYRIERKRIKR